MTLLILLQDPILRDALLDVGFNHCLLKEHIQILITPTIKKYNKLKSKVIQERIALSLKKSSEVIAKRMANQNLSKERSLSSSLGFRDEELSDVSSAFEVLCDSDEENEYVKLECIETEPLDVRLPETFLTLPSHQDDLSFSGTPSSIPFGTPLQLQAAVKEAAKEGGAYRASSPRVFQSLSLSHVETAPSEYLSCQSIGHIAKYVWVAFNN